MPTTTVKTIGTAARQYSTLQAWEDACPANLTTSISGGEIWQGECYNDSEFLVTSTNILTISGQTTDATGYLHLTTGAGQSFLDHANKLTNALFYNQAKGVGIRSNGNYADLMVNSAAYTRFSKLQVKNDNGAGVHLIKTNGVSNCKIDQCILHSGTTGSAIGNALVRVGTSIIVTNTLLVSGGCYCFYNDSVSGVEYHNLTMVALATAAQASNDGYTGTYPLWKNCAVFGFTNIRAGASSGINASSDYNATDLTAPTNWGANSLASLTFASQFENSASDFRAKSSGSLGTSGTRDQTYTGDLDIISQARSTTAPTIGAWEYVAPPAANAPRGYFDPDLNIRAWF